MDNCKASSLTEPFIIQSNSQSDELLLWQEYSQKLSTIAGVYSDSYWVTQGLGQLNISEDYPIQSKTKQALRLLNGRNSKLELIEKILKNLSLCRKIEDNQEKLVEKVLKTTQEWEKWKKSCASKLDFQQIFGNGDVSGNDEHPQNIDSFEVDFDEKKLQEFGEGYGYEEKDVEI